MFSGKSIIGAGLCTALAACSLTLHVRVDNCSPRVELCAPSDLAALPDEPAPEHAPPQGGVVISVAGSSVSAPSSALAISAVTFTT